MRRFLLCTDLDRTLIQNGTQPESPAAKERFKRLVSCEEVVLAYVTGRHRALIEQAIADYRFAATGFCHRRCRHDDLPDRFRRLAAVG